jgi:hypothetical protein
MNTENKSMNILSKFVMNKLNNILGSWDLRRVSPILKGRCLWDTKNKLTSTVLCPILHFATRLDPTVQAKLNAVKESNNKIAF